jgi:hypothetical protein
MFNAPGVPTVEAPCCALQPGGDPGTPDIIVAPNIGGIYTGSASKQEEQGGFAFDETKVMLLVSNPSLAPRNCDELGGDHASGAHDSPAFWTSILMP